MSGNKKDSKTSVSDTTKKNEEESAELVRICVLIISVFAVFQNQYRPEFRIK
jgi:hypothetical protein